MTREEAIKIIDCYDINFYDLSGEKIPAGKLAEAFDMAIEALSERHIAREIATILENEQDMRVILNLVRCKDCKNWRESHSEDEESYCYIDGRTTDSTDYCSWGERREP